MARLSSAAGDVQARELKKQLRALVLAKTGVTISAVATLDQMVRHATKAGVNLTFYGWLEK